MDEQRLSHWVFVLQVLSVSMIWVFVISISIWILHLLSISHRWSDVPSASVGISIVAIPVFITGASVLTYVFVGLRRGARPAAVDGSGGGDGGHRAGGDDGAPEEA